MNRITMLVLLLAGTLAATPPMAGANGSQPIPPSEPAPPPMTNALPAAGAPVAAAPKLAQAKAAFAQLQSGSLDRSMLDTQMNAALTEDKVSAVKAAIGPLGTPATFVEVRTGTQGGYPYGVYLVTFANGTKVNFVFALDNQGKIAGMQLTPPQ